MGKEKEFAEALQQLVKMASSQGNVIAKEQITEQFATWNLGEEQLELIHAYLKQHKIGIDEAVNLDDYLTADDVHYLDMYLEELEALPKWSATEKQEVIALAMKGNADAQGRLIEAYLPEVVEISKLYAGQGVLVEDLIGEGNVAVTLGVKMIECAEDSKEAEGMLAKLIMDAMETYIGENLETGEADKKILEKINKISDAAKQLAENEGRKVTVSELVQETEYSAEEILEAIEVTAGNIEYIEGKQNADE